MADSESTTKEGSPTKAPTSDDGAWTDQHPENAPIGTVTYSLWSRRSSFRGSPTKGKVWQRRPNGKHDLTEVFDEKRARRLAAYPPNKYNGLRACIIVPTVPRRIYDSLARMLKGQSPG